MILQDRTLVRLLSTAYEMRPESENYTIGRHHCPLCSHNCDTYHDLIDQLCGNQPVRELGLPTTTVEYNLHRGGVDIAAQQRRYYSTQMHGVRRSMPLLFCLLNTTDINSSLIAQQHMGGGRNLDWESHS